MGFAPLVQVRKVQPIRKKAHRTTKLKGFFIQINSVTIAKQAHEVKRQGTKKPLKQEVFYASQNICKATQEVHTARLFHSRPSKKPVTTWLSKTNGHPISIDPRGPYLPGPGRQDLHHSPPLGDTGRVLKGHGRKGVDQKLSASKPH